MRAGDPQSVQINTFDMYLFKIPFCGLALSAVHILLATELTVFISGRSQRALLSESSNQTASVFVAMWLMQVDL